jgi:hypothetical protein
MVKELLQTRACLSEEHGVRTGRPQSRKSVTGTPLSAWSLLRRV